MNRLAMFTRGRVAVLTIVATAVLISLFAVHPVSAQERPTLFITPPTDSFQTYLSAAFLKKAVPVAVMMTADHAVLVLTAANEDRKARVEGSEIAKCALFAIGCNHVTNIETSVQLTKGDAVVWSYTSNERNKKNLAEDIAKHLKSEYFQKR